MLSSKPFAYILAVLALGVASQIGQVLFLREFLTVFHGNELSLGLILSAWLFWAGLGSRLGGFCAERSPKPLSWLAFTSGGLFLILPGSLLLIRILRGLFPVLPGAYLSLGDMALSCFLLQAPACLLLGMHFVFLSRVWRLRRQTRDTSGAAKVYMLEAAGNSLGGALFTLVLVRHLSQLCTALLTGSLLLAALLLLAGCKQNLHPLPKGQSLLLFALLAGAAAALPYLGALEEAFRRIQWHHFAPEHRLLQTWQSKYGNIAVLQHQHQYTFMQSAQLLFSITGPKGSNSGLEQQQAAAFAHLAMLQHQDPQKVLLLGGGLRGTLPEMLKHPVKRIDYLQLDQTLLQAVQDYAPEPTLQALQDPRVRIKHMDGRLFIKQARESYELIIADLPDPTTAALNRYYTLEFFQEARDLLQPNGVLVCNLSCAADLRDTALVNRNASIYHSLDQVFSQVLVAGGEQMLFFASQDKTQIAVDPAVLQKRFLQRKIQSQSFAASHFQVLLPKSQVRRANWIMHNHGRSAGDHLQGPQGVPLILPSIQEQQERDLPEIQKGFFLNRDFKPIGYYYSLMYWDRLTRKKSTHSLDWILGLKLWWFWPLGALLLLTGLGLRAAGKPRGKTWSASYALLFTVFSTGLSTMTLQMALLFAFQSIYGFVYEMLGLIVALFMAGLGLGSAAAQRFIRDKGSINNLIVVQICMACLGLLIALALFWAPDIKSGSGLLALFMTLTLGAGLLNGLDFPLAAACCQGLYIGAEKATGLAYGLELVGACLGAVLASAVLIPVQGILVCCLLAAAGNAAAGLLLLLSRREYVRFQP
jgi:spermidine synthase